MSSMLSVNTVVLLFVSALTLIGCASTDSVDDAPSERSENVVTADAVPHAEPRSRYGNPKSYVVFGKRYHTLETSRGFTERGIASWYGTKFHGRRTSSGEIYDMYAMTAAHKNLPLPTYVQVTNLDNGKQVVVKVNDRGPFVDGRIIDLSYSAATKIDMLRKGTARVEIRVLTPGESVPPVSTNSPAANYGIYVQAGAFVDVGNAESLHIRLQAIPVSPVRVQRLVSAGRILQAVRVGPFVSSAKAQQVMSMVLRAGIANARIVIVE